MRRELLELLRAQRAPLFAVLDAARSGRVLKLLQGTQDKYQSLYEGPEAEKLSRVAPYLLAVSKDSMTLERLVNDGWGQSWGVYLSCRLPFTDVRRHLRRFLLVESEETREQLYFRFYDPRVLRAFLPGCSPQQWREFFGETECFWMESKEGGISTFPRSMMPA
ncbi:DUF4123 domain-containing protein [Vitiosangium sp. GDMCC 1.1324]|uniref:DUF4123 domain-containing protein n=1 Tax=Vitiosangium sp. (strain GDMCC 1.1324) TaxID=2138576 RepID=UPI00130D708B|nr:DUF4123 domain-containing protein [Vitiosangium sp. GDMCC 1.1324]